MRIFLIEPVNNFDMTPAAKFGELVVLFTERINPLRVPMANICKALEANNFDADTDMLCLTGRSTTLALLMSAATYNYGLPLKVLMFDSRAKEYNERILDDTCAETEALEGATEGSCI